MPAHGDTEDGVEQVDRQHVGTVGDAEQHLSVVCKDVRWFVFIAFTSTMEMTYIFGFASLFTLTVVTHFWVSLLSRFLLPWVCKPAGRVTGRKHEAGSAEDSFVVALAGERDLDTAPRVQDGASSKVAAGAGPPMSI